MNVDHDRDGGVDLGELLDDEARGGEGRTAPAVLLRHLHAHEPSVEDRANQFRLHL